MNKILPNLIRLAGRKRLWVFVVLVLMVALSIYLVYSRSLVPISFFYSVHGNLRFRVYLIALAAVSLFMLFIGCIVAFIFDSHLANVESKVSNMKHYMSALARVSPSNGLSSAPAPINQDPGISFLMKKTTFLEQKIDHLDHKLSDLCSLVSSIKPPSVASSISFSDLISAPGMPDPSPTPPFQKQRPPLSLDPPTSPIEMPALSQNLLHEVKEHFPKQDFFRERLSEFRPMKALGLEAPVAVDGKNQISITDASSLTSADYLLFACDNSTYLVPNPLGGRFLSSLSEMRSGSSALYQFIPGQSDQIYRILELARLTLVKESLWSVQDVGTIQG